MTRRAAYGYDPVASARIARARLTPDEIFARSVAAVRRREEWERTQWRLVRRPWWPYYVDRIRMAVDVLRGTHDCGGDDW